MNRDLFVKLLRYLIVFTTVYLVARFIPKYKTTNMNALIVAVVVLILVVGGEYLYNMMYSKGDTCSNGNCSVTPSAPEPAPVTAPVKQEVKEVKKVDKTNEKDVEEKKESFSDNNNMRTLLEKVDNLSREMKDLKSEKMTNGDYNDYDDDDDYNPQSAHDLPVKPDSFEYGYSFLPPDKWYPQPPRPPVCVTDKKCPVCPVMSTSGYTDLKNWKDSTHISPPQNIDTDYIDRKLNRGVESRRRFSSS